MKKVLILIAGIAIMSSCKKCAECTIETTVYTSDLYTGSSNNISTSVTEEQCGKKKDVDEWKSDMEAAEYSLVIFGNGTEVKTTCRDTD